jgi:hypothetical protein
MSDDGLFDEGDPFDDPAWKKVEEMVGAPPKPAKGYITVPLAWLVRVRQLVRSVDQLIVLLLLYRQCLVSRNRTVAFGNTEVEVFGINRRTKTRTLVRLEDVGEIMVERKPGQVPRVTLHRFP